MAAVANTAGWSWYHWWAAAAVAAVLLRRRRVVKMQESSTSTAPAGRLTGGQRRLNKEQLQTGVYVSAWFESIYTVRLQDSVISCISKS
jgi:hypothetical protein